MYSNSKINTISRFIFINNLQPADVIIARKIQAGLLDHYVVYLGPNQHGEHYFAANLKTSVGIFSANNLGELTTQYGPVSIRKFMGNDKQRRKALERAMKKFNKGKPYNLITNNCEHYANYVQTGSEYSQQSSVGYGAVAAGGLTMALASNNPLLQILGVAIATVGTIGVIEEQSKKPSLEDKRLAGPRTKLLR